MAQLFGKNY
jgi:hypothetical protein